MNDKGHKTVTKASLRLIRLIDPSNVLASDLDFVQEVANASVNCDKAMDLELVNVQGIRRDNPHTGDDASMLDLEDESRYTDFDNNFTAFNHFIDIRKGPGEFDDYDGYSYNRGSGSQEQFETFEHFLLVCTHSGWAKNVLANVQTPPRLMKADQGLMWWFNDEYAHAPGHPWYQYGKCSPSIERYSRPSVKGVYPSVEDECCARFPLAEAIGKEGCGVPYSVFMPIDNLAKYWFDQFMQLRSEQALGMVMHAIQDAVIPHHAAGCNGNWHQSYENEVGQKVASWISEESFEQEAKALAEQWLKIDKNPPTALGVNDYAKSPSITWPVDLLVTWLALHAYREYANTYQGFRYGYSFNDHSARELTKLAVAMGALIVLKLDSRYQAPKLVVRVLNGTPGSTEVAFGDVIVSDYREKKVEFSNAGGGTITLGTPVISGDFNTSNLEIYPTGATIGFGETYTMTLSFHPQSRGSYSGNVTITTDELNYPMVSLGLTARAIMPVLNVHPMSINFGDVEVGGFKNETLFLSNVGDVQAYVKIGPDFEQANPPGQFEHHWSGGYIEIAPGDFYSIEITYEPHNAGSVHAVLPIEYHPPRITSLSQTVRVTLDGKGFVRQPVLSVTPALLDFGFTSINTQSREPIRIQNLGQSELIVTRLYIQNTAGPWQFYIEELPSTDSVRDLKILPGAWQDIDIVFLPTVDATTYMADLYIESNDPEKPSVVTKLGGATPGANIMILPEVVAFSKNLVVGRRIEILRNVTIESTGTANLVVSEIRLREEDQLQQLLQMFEQALWPLPPAVVARILDELRQGRVPAELKAYLREPGLQLEDLYPFCLRGSALTPLPATLPRNSVLTFQVIFRAWCIGHFENALEVLSNAISGKAEVQIVADCRKASIGPSLPLNPRESTNPVIATAET